MGLALVGGVFYGCALSIVKEKNLLGEGGR